MRSKGIGALLPVLVTIPLPSWKAILRNSFNIVSSPMLLEQGGGFGIPGQGGGSLERRDIKSIMPEDLETERPRRVTG